jgi:hypothetical protein
MKVYISGPIAHYDLNERKATFKCIENALLELGLEPVNPFNNGVPDDAHWRDHMKADIALLLQCDRIYLMSGWELSKGCKLELDVASSVGIPILNRYEPHPVQISCAG